MAMTTANETAKENKSKRKMDCKGEGIVSDKSSEVEDASKRDLERTSRLTSAEIIYLDNARTDEQLRTDSEYAVNGETQETNRNLNLYHNETSKNKIDNDESGGTSSEGDEKYDSDSDMSSKNSSSDIEDVTDICLAKKKGKLLQDINYAIELNDSGSESDIGIGKNKPTKEETWTTVQKHQKRTAVREPPIEVLIEEENFPTCPGKNCVTNNEVMDHSIKQRIVKLLNTGFHGESNENEARNAMKLAQRLIERYNLDQAMLLQERGDGSLNDFSTSSDNNDSSALVGGIVYVDIVNRRKKTTLTSLPRWIRCLIHPVSTNFNVDAFIRFYRSSTNIDGKCTVAFYGLKTNCQLAAYAFKVSSERIALMAASYDPPAAEPLEKKSTNTRTARVSYALGIVVGLKRYVENSLKQVNEDRKSELDKARQMASMEKVPDNVKDVAKGENVSPDQYELIQTGQRTLEKLERESTLQLALFNHQEKIASDILKSNNIKIRAARKFQKACFNNHAYERGILDSKQIDLNQQTLQDG